MNSLLYVIGMSSYYFYWIVTFSEKISPLLKVKTFPPLKIIEIVFKCFKAQIENAVIHSFDETFYFLVEVGASDVAITTFLNQTGRPLNACEQKTFDNRKRSICYSGELVKAGILFS